MLPVGLIHQRIIGICVSITFLKVYLNVGRKYSKLPCNLCSDLTALEKLRGMQKIFKRHRRSSIYYVRIEGRGLLDVGNILVRMRTRRGPN